MTKPNIINGLDLTFSSCFILLFEEDREIELIWNGKSKEITNIVLPFQTIEHVDEPRTEIQIKKQLDLFDINSGRQLKGWTNKLIWGDNKFILSSLKNKNLSNKKILITSGATIERIDPVRYISNDSSGIQGTSIANALIRKGAEVIFVTGKSTYEKPLGAKIINVESAREMYDAVFKNGPYNVAICVAAVSDWYVDNKNSKKIKKSSLKSPQISLKENPDILSDISKSKNRPELVIGFAAETDDLIKNAKSKLNQKGCDIIVANKIDNKSSVFGNLENKVS